MPRERQCRKCGLRMPSSDLQAHQAMHRAEQPKRTHFTRLCYRCGVKISAAQWDEHNEREHKTRPSDTRARRKVRDAVFKRDAYRCAKCGRAEYELKLQGLQLEAHHLNNLPEDHRPENLLTLCSSPECHPRGDYLGNAEKPSHTVFTHKLTSEQ
jgi:5-methylcytosine-specific restriction endonuclease McrA